MATDQSTLENYKSSDLQVCKTTGASPTFAMGHKMGLAKLDMTTGKQVPTTRTYTFSSSAGTATISDSSGKTTIKAHHAFSSASNYCVPLYASTANSDCYFIVKSNGASSNASSKFGCGVIKTTEYWSDITVSDIGYGRYATKSINSDRPAAGMVANFAYVGAKQTFTVPWYGSYQIECWGANGGPSPITDPTGKAVPGKGGYTKGTISLVKSINLYVYVGGVGSNSKSAVATENAGGFNGGGISGYNSDADGCAGGGGATDVRLISHTSGTWGYNSSSILCDDSMRYRIMVAGGGGGCSYMPKRENSSNPGGCGGGLIGGRGTSTMSSYNTSTAVSPGGLQDAVEAWMSQTTEDNTHFRGAFGRASQLSNYPFSSWGSGGGSGWYGGCKGIGNGGGGGSSYILGHPGCNPVNFSTGAHMGTSTTSLTYSGNTYGFSSTVMIDGDGYSWTSASETRVYQSATVPGLPKIGSTTASKPGLPTKPASNNHGYARITFVP